MKHRSAILVLLLLLSAPARADDAVPEKVAKKEESTLKTVAGEVLKLAKLCGREKAFDAARSELGRGLALAPDDKGLRDELARIAGERDAAKATFAAKYETERKKTHEKCADLLADLAQVCERAKTEARWACWVEAIAEQYPSEKALQKAGAVYFEPYVRWVKPADKKKLDAGGEEVEGKWLEKGAVEALDRRHASWSDPWVLADDVHEVKTALPLRTAKRLLAHIGAYRRFFLRELAGSWDLKAPAGKLPVIVTGTQKDLKEQTAAFGGQAAALADQMRGAAYYLMTSGTLNPCFVTFEPTDVTGRTTKITFEQVLYPLKHELTHQICFEYSKHAYDAGRMPESQFWSVEGIANFTAYYTVEKGKWRLGHPKMMRLGEGFIEGAFAWCVANEAAIPPLERFFAIPREQFMTVQNYHIAATVAYFLTLGEKGKYRSAFVRLLEAVHRVRETDATFDECFAGIDKKALDQEFRRFVRGLKIEEAPP